jgi:subtilase family serine protease
VGEDPTVTAQFDTLLSQAAAANVSVIAPVGDYGGTTSSPATSPFVTAVGGTLYRIDAAGNRIYETATLNAGGGQSTLEPLPAFQQGVRIGKKTLPSRAVPDLSLIADTRGLGVDVYYDPTLMNNSPIQWYTVEGTSVSAPVFAGMVADANELRQNVGLGPIGEQLNPTLYQGFRQYSSVLYTDITQGNNVLHAAVKGFDLATGMGAPRAVSLIPYLAGIVNVNANIKVSGYFSTGISTSSSKLVTFQGSGVAQVGSQYVSMNVPLNTSDRTSNTPTTIVFTPTLITRAPDNSITGFGTVVVTTLTLDPVTGLPISIPQTFNVQITGVVRGKALQPRIVGQFFTIDPLTGRRIPPGSAPTVQASFRT